jgi:hypothetical protein
MDVVAYRADSTHPRDVVDVGLQVLLQVDINAFVDLKDKYLPLGLKKAIRRKDHLFWHNEGLKMWADIEVIINEKIGEEFVFGRDDEDPQVIGIFKRST